MHTRLWLAGTTTLTLVAAGVYLASPIVHGQAARTPGADPFGAVRQAVQEAARTAQEVVRDLDVEVIVDHAFQDVPDMAVLDSRPRIGVRTRDLTAEEAKAAGLAGITGALVAEVPADSAAAKAGLTENDIIVSVDGETIRSARQLARVIAESPEGRGLQVGYVRGTAHQAVTVTPAPPSATRPRLARPDDGGDGPVVRRFERRVTPGRPGGPPEADMRLPRPPGGDQEFFFRQAPGGAMRMWAGRGRLGVVGQPVTDQLATYFGVKEGVLVTRVTEGSASAQAGIKAGDVITSVNGKAVKDTGDILDHLQDVTDGTAVQVAITREKKSQSLSVTLKAPADTDRSAPRRPRFTA